MARTYEVCTREQAAAAGRATYFTGEPCKHGHTALRYVANSGCLDCANKWRRLKARNPHSHDLIPYNCPTFWRSKRLSDAQVVQMTAYLQECIHAYTAHLLPPLCKTCDGTHYVPKGDGSNDWKLCPDCPVDIK